MRHIARRYPGYELYILDSLTYAGELENIPEDIRKSSNFHFLHKDIRDREAVEDAVKKVDTVVHFVSQSHVSYSFVEADLFVDTNVRGTSILCETIHKFPVEKFIHISSSEVYGTALKVPMNEDHPLLPCSPYAGSKAAADRLAYSFFKTYDIPLLIIRPFNNYGFYQHIEKVIPYFVTQAIQDKPLTIHDDGLQTRDWIFVEDCCEAIDSAIHLRMNEVRGEVINIGTGTDTSVLSIARMILSQLGKSESLIKFEGNRPGQVQKHVSSTKKARKILHWRTKTSFKEGIKKTVNWYLENERWWKNLRKP